MTVKNVRMLIKLVTVFLEFLPLLEFLPPLFSPDFGTKGGQELKHFP